MTLQDIQAVSLDIMKHLDVFCEENRINYSLGYGSLIGAIRHKGFIPWDDDLDVLMMREDFDRFCSIYKDTKEYKLYSYNRGNTYSAVARLCDMQRTRVNTVFPLFTEPTGLWIDIFPLDSIDDDCEVFRSKIEMITKAHSDVIKCRSQIRKMGLNDIRHVKTFVLWLLHYRKARKSIWKLVKQQNDLCVSIAGSDSHRMSVLAFPTYIKKDFSPKSVFYEVIKTSFENESFSIMKGYDEWLKIIYGDYMTPPPIEKQTRGHQAHKYYWK